jgi:hypothetical protein
MDNKGAHLIQSQNIKINPSIFYHISQRVFNAPGSCFYMPFSSLAVTFTARHSVTCDVTTESIRYTRRSHSLVT